MTCVSAGEGVDKQVEMKAYDSPMEFRSTMRQGWG
jgi:hypothetical protein